MRPDAADDAVTGDRERRCGRQRRVHRADDAVRDDHARSVDRGVAATRQGATIELSDRRMVRWDSRARWRSSRSCCSRLSSRRYLLARRRRPRYAVRYTNVEVLRQVAPARRAASRAPGGAARRRRRSALLCVAVARPEMTRSAPIENATVVLVVDTSRSMLVARRAADPPRRRRSRPRRRFLERAPDRLRVGLVTFAGDVTVAAFPTHDRALVRESVAAISRWSAGGGTAIGDALVRAVEVGGDAFGEEGLPVPSGRARRDEPGHDPLPLGRTPEPGAGPRGRGRGDRAARRHPRLHGRARHEQPGRSDRGSASAAAPTGCRTARRSARSLGRPAASTSRRARPRRSRRRTPTSARASGGSGAGRRSRTSSSPPRGSRWLRRPPWVVSGRRGFPDGVSALQAHGARPGCRAPSGGLCGRKDVLVHPEDVVRVVLPPSRGRAGRSSGRRSPSPGPGPRPS